MKLRISALHKNASTKQDVAIANVYDNKTILYCQSGLRNRLCHEITFNDYDRVIVSQGSPEKPDTKYEIADVSF